MGSHPVSQLPCKFSGSAPGSTLTDLFQHNILEQQYFNQNSCLLDTRIALLPGTHDISGDRRSNTLFNISCSENVIFTALDPQVGATIRCSGFIGFRFNRATNLSIHDLTFENCGFFSTQHLWFISLAVDNTMDIDINNLMIRGSREVGLFIGNSYGNINIVKLHLQDNPRHFHFLMDETEHADVPGRKSLTDVKTHLIMESCSIFQGGKDFGLRIYSIQRMYKIKLQLRNIIVCQNRNRAIDIRLNEMCNGVISMENLTVIESRDSVVVLLSRQRNCNPFTASVKVDHALFKDCGFSIDTRRQGNIRACCKPHTDTLVQRSHIEWDGSMLEVSSYKMSQLRIAQVFMNTFSSVS